MSRNPIPLDAHRMKLSTWMAQKRVNDTIMRAQALATDADKEARLKAHLCMGCHYFPSIAGQAFTDKPCGCCSEIQTYSTTRTDELCQPCAERHGLCKRCGGNIDVHATRASWPDFTKQQEPTP